MLACLKKKEKKKIFFSLNFASFSVQSAQSRSLHNSNARTFKALLIYAVCILSCRSSETSERRRTMSRTMILARYVPYQSRRKIWFLSSRRILISRVKTRKWYVFFVFSSPTSRFDRRRMMMTMRRRAHFVWFWPSLLPFEKGM